MSTWGSQDPHLINAIIDTHADHPEFGYRFIADELQAVGRAASDHRVQRLGALQSIASSIVRNRRGSATTPGPPVHDDHVNRDCHAEGLDEIRLAAMSEHPTAEGSLHICAVKDVCSRRIVGYAVGPRMTAQLADAALRTAIASRRPTGSAAGHGRGTTTPGRVDGPGAATGRAEPNGSVGLCGTAR